MRFLLPIVLLSLASCTHHAFQSSDSCTRIPLYSFPCTDSPILKADIDGKRYALQIDTGANTAFKLQKRVLDQIHNKEPKGMSNGSDIKGNQYEEPQFLLPEVKFEDLKAEGALAEEESVFFRTHGSKIWPPPEAYDRRTRKQLNDIDGRIGNDVFRAFSTCYFDISRSVLFVAKGIENIQRNCSLEGFIEVPIEISKGWTIISAETELGTKKFLLDTGASVSVFRKSVIDTIHAEELHDGIWEFNTTLSFGGCDFGKKKFWVFQFPEKISEFDGVLGMDFLKEHAICLDFQNNKAFIQPTKNRFWNRLSRFFANCISNSYLGLIVRGPLCAISFIE